MSRRFVPSSTSIPKEQVVTREASYTAYINHSSLFPDPSPAPRSTSRLKHLRLTPLTRRSEGHDDSQQQQQQQEPQGVPEPLQSFAHPPSPTLVPSPSAGPVFVDLADGVATPQRNPSSPTRSNSRRSSPARSPSFRRRSSSVFTTNFSDVLQSLALISNPMNDDNDNNPSEGDLSHQRDSFFSKLKLTHRASVTSSPPCHPLPTDGASTDAPHPAAAAAAAAAVTNTSPARRVSPKRDASLPAVVPHRFRARNIMAQTAEWGRTPYLDEIHAFEPPSSFPAPFHLTQAELHVTKCRPQWVRPGDNVAVRVTKFYGSMRSMMLRDRMRKTVTYVGDLIQQEVSYKTDQFDADGYPVDAALDAMLGEVIAVAGADKGDEEAEAKDTDEAGIGGVLGMKLSSIAHVDKLKFSVRATRLHAVSFAHRRRDCQMRERFIVNIEKSIFEIKTFLNYEDFVVVYRQFNRYTRNGPNLYHSRMPKNGWYFVDRNIRNLLARKIDRAKRGFILFSDLIRHIFPAHSVEETTKISEEYTKRYLKFSDPTIDLLVDQLEVSKVDHFASVFSILDKQCCGRVTRSEFVHNMPIDESSRDHDVEEMRFFLGVIFDKHARSDITEKLEFTGEPYMDLECLCCALNAEKVNDYSGSLVL